MSRYSSSIVFVIVVLAFAVGLVAGADGGSAGAGPTRGDRAAPGLGSPAAAVMAAEGSPLRIEYGPDHQIWYYANDKGVQVGRYTINQGLVVLIRE